MINLPGQSFASGSLDKTILIWDKFFINHFSLNSHSGGINSLIFVKNTYLLSASKDTTIVKWNLVNQLVKNGGLENAHKGKSVQQVTLIGPLK